MLARPSPLGALLGLTLIAAAAVASCGGGAKSTGGTSSTGASGTGGAGAGTTTGHGGNDGGIVITGTGGGACSGFDVQPVGLQTITVTAGQMTPTVKLDATLNCSPASPGWGVDKGNVGSVPGAAAPSVVFTPTGTTGGLVTITASLNKQTVTRQVLVKLTASQNGPTPAEIAAMPSQIPTTAGQLTAGGGVGGVGGEGLGTAVADPATVTALGAPTGNGSAQGLTFLYPYDKTVWPRGMLAPLLMWTWSTGDADAIKVDLTTTTGSFTWSGTFGRPAILGAAGKFIRMPIPQDVWDMATNTAGGKSDLLTVSLTVAKGGMAYGPISETWTVAPARLSGTIYYNSYGTQLAHNYSGAVGGNGQFGGAVLSIHVGDTAPKLVAGTNVAVSGCRVCHSVAADGSRLIVQHGDNYGASSAYDLGVAAEHPMTHDASFPALYPDGSMALTEGGVLLPLPTDTTPIATTGLTSVVTDLGQPAFSPDGKMITFNPLGGPGVKPGQTLYVMAFAKATSAFSGATLVSDDTGKPVSTRPGWAAFFPDSKSVVFHHQTGASSCDGATSVVTRSGARAQVYWTDLSGPASVTPLDQLNGKGYLPKLAATSGVACNDACGTASSPQIGTLNADHSDDVNVNYEPTVAPVAEGGYAWVVFTSRRMYGSVATIGSFCSDPRGVDLIKNITPKKLWVAAIDLTQAPGADASHPAFYLPAQELLAGNARGFWTLDPCKADGASCQSGDQCCNGYCEPNGPMGALLCSSTPPMNSCSNVGDKCTTAADCCDPTNVCINGFCSIKAPQ